MTSSVPAVYMDSCCFIDMAKTVVKMPTASDREPHIYFCRKFIEAARAKHATVYTSTATVVECVKLTDNTAPGGPAREDATVKGLFRGMLMSGRSGVLPVMPTPVITELARDLRWNHGITCSAMDRLHVATAIAMKCSHYFTTDDKMGEQNILKIRGLGLAVCRANAASDLLPDQYKQLHLSEHKHGKQDRPSDQRSAPAA